VLVLATAAPGAKTGDTATRSCYAEPGHLTDRLWERKKARRAAAGGLIHTKDRPMPSEMQPIGRESRTKTSC